MLLLKQYFFCTGYAISSKLKSFEAILTCKMQYTLLAPFFATITHVHQMGTYSKYAISHIILRIIQSNKNHYTLETFLYRIMLIFLIVKILSEGTFSGVVAQLTSM